MLWVTEYFILMCPHAVTLKFKCHLKPFLKTDSIRKCRKKEIYQISAHHLHQNIFFPKRVIYKGLLRVIVKTYVECLLCVRHCAKWLNLSNPYNKYPMTCHHCYPHFILVKELFKFTQLTPELESKPRCTCASML